MKLKFLLLFLLCSMYSFSQQLSYKSCGRVLNAESKTLSKNEVRSLLAAQPELLNSYNKGKSKKRLGNILLYSGIAVTAGSLVASYGSDSEILPLAFLGVGLVAVAIPVRIGYSRKIRAAVDGYNKQLVLERSVPSYGLAICTNQNGVGFRLSL